MKNSNLDFLIKFLSLYRKELTFLSVLLLWATSTRVKKHLYSDKILIYFNNTNINLEPIHCIDFELVDQRYKGFNKLDSDPDYFIIGKSDIFILGNFEFHVKNNLIKNFKAERLSGVAV